MLRKIYFFLVCSFFALTICAQSPGGVSANLKLWVRGNSGTSTVTNGASLASWTYANDGTKTFNQPGGVPLQPIYLTNSLNFQPTVDFQSQFLLGPTGVDAPIAALDDDQSMFAVWSADTYNFGRIWAQRPFGGFANNGDGFSLAAFGTGFQTYGNQIEFPPYTHTVTRPYDLNTWNITQLNVLNQPLADLEIIDDRNFSSGPLVINTDPANVNGPAIRNLSTDLNILGARTALATDESFDGKIAEVIVYDAPISGAERNRVFSYLAIKYGSTLKTNLVSSANTIVWDATANTTFNNAVFGLAQDDNSALLVSSSNSVITGSGNGTGISGAGNIVLSGATSLANNDFFIIGNDNAPLAETTTDIPAVITGSQRVGREWKVQETGDVGNINLSFDLTGLTVTGTIGTTSNFRLMIDGDGDGNFNTGTIRYVAPTSFTGNVLNFTGVTLDNNEVFTFLTFTVPPTLPVTWKSFTATGKDDGVYLEWKIDNNDQALNYIVERSTDGIHFSSIGTVINDKNIQGYNYIDRSVNEGNLYYRIRQNDFDGRYVYSAIASVKFAPRDLVAYLLRNPVTNNRAELVLKSSRSRAENAVVELWTLNGAKISSQKATIATGTNNVYVNLDKVPAGNYILKVNIGEFNSNLKLLKQ